MTLFRDTLPPLPLLFKTLISRALIFPGSFLFDFQLFQLLSALLTLILSYSFFHNVCCRHFPCFLTVPDSFDPVLPPLRPLSRFENCLFLLTVGQTSPARLLLHFTDFLILGLFPLRQFSNFPPIFCKFPFPPTSASNGPLYIS